MKMVERTRQSSAESDFTLHATPPSRLLCTTDARLRSQLLEAGPRTAAAPSSLSLSSASYLGYWFARRNAPAERLFAVKFSRSEMAVKQKEKLKGTACILAAAEVTVRWNVSLANRVTAVFCPASCRRLQWVNRLGLSQLLRRYICCKDTDTPEQLALQEPLVTLLPCNAVAQDEDGRRQVNVFWRSRLTNWKYADDLRCLCSLEVIKPGNPKVFMEFPRLLFTNGKNTSR